MKLKRIDRLNKPYKVYAESLEGTAIEQFVGAMEQDFVIQGALMPDSHTGYTLPIGAVIATDDYVVPAYIGYDIGCTDKDTEFLTVKGWKTINDYQGEEILVYNSEEDVCSFQLPTKYIVKDCEYFNYFDNKTVNQMLSDEHKILLYKGSRSRGYNKVDILASDLVIKNSSLKKGIQGGFQTVFTLADCKGIDFLLPQIRLQIAISADGTIRKRKNGSDVIEFYLKKQRKIDRLLSILEDCGIVPNLHTRVNGNFSCSFIPPLATKSLSFLWSANEEQLKVASDECIYWDGHKTKEGKISFSNNNKETIDVIQYAFAVSGVRTSYCKVEYDNKSWNPTYQLYSGKNSIVGVPKSEDIKRVNSVDGKSYCFTTETGYWVQRRNGKITITGNCGMCALPTDFDKGDVEVNGQKIFDALYAHIPVGINRNEKPFHWNQNKLTHTNVVKGIYRDHGSAQLGTLGGGNHFVEVGYDENDKVWIVIHSGSRKVGHSTATHYMKEACLLATGINKAREGHYGFDTHSQLGQEYMQDLYFCLEFALENRKEMMRRAITAIQNTCSGQGIWGELINRNHNHAELVNGRWIHRKGATHADNGMMGVIPGNMRDGSFIVEGKGNVDSMCSSSHGAGRVLGRRKAKEQLNVVDFENTMNGVVALVSKNTLDESPMAYKDIFEVMRLQEDLVSVHHHIKPLVNIKG